MIPEPHIDRYHPATALGIILGCTAGLWAGLWVLSRVLTAIVGG